MSTADRYVPLYRVIEHACGFEPQMRYKSGVTGQEQWFPLNEAGYWLEPNAYEYGEITRRMVFRERAEAERVVVRARAINGEHIGVAASASGKESGSAAKPQR